MADTLLERLARARARDLRRDTGQRLLEAREARELSLRAVAEAAGVDRSVLADAEAGETTLTTDAIAAVATALGMEPSLQIYPTVGPRLRDHVQARMVDALLAPLHPRWQPRPEVPVWHPVRGVIDLVLVDRESPTTVACESHGELRRVEEQVRWANEKADALAELPEFQGRTVCRLLLLRNCAAMRALVASVPNVFAAAYPGVTRDAVETLVDGRGAMPGAAILWVDVRVRQPGCSRDRRGGSRWGADARESEPAGRGDGPPVQSPRDVGRRRAGGESLRSADQMSWRKRMVGAQGRGRGWAPTRPDGTLGTLCGAVPCLLVPARSFEPWSVSPCAASRTRAESPFPR